MKNEVFASAMAGILFGFSALLMMFNKEEYVSGGLLAISGLLMIIHAVRIRNKKSICKKQGT